MRSKNFCRPAIRLKQGTFAPWHDSDVRTRTGSLISLMTLPKQIDAWPKSSLTRPAKFIAMEVLCLHFGSAWKCIASSQQSPGVSRTVSFATSDCVHVYGLDDRKRDC